MSEKKKGASLKKPAKFCQECKLWFAYKNWSRHCQRLHSQLETTEETREKMEEPISSKVRLIRRCAARAGALFAYNHSRKVVEDSVRKRDKDLSTSDQLLCIEAADAIVLNIRHHMNNATVENPVPIAAGCTGSPASHASEEGSTAMTSRGVVISETLSQSESETKGDQSPETPAKLSEATQQKSELDRRIDDVHASIEQSSQDSVIQSSQPRESRIAKEKYTPKKKEGSQKEEIQMGSQPSGDKEVSASSIEPSNVGSGDIIIGAEEEDSNDEDDPFKACVLTRDRHSTPHTITTEAPATTGRVETFVCPDVRPAVIEERSAPRYEGYSAASSQSTLDRHDKRRDGYRNSNRRESRESRESSHLSRERGALRSLLARRGPPDPEWRHRRERRASRSPVARRRSPDREWLHRSRREEELQRRRRELQKELRGINREIGDKRR